MPFQVPNYVPIHTAPQRICCVGDFPSKEDTMINVPFNDPNGLIVRSLFQQQRVNANNIMFANLDQFFAPHKKLLMNSDTFQISQRALSQDIETFNPNIIILFGPEALRLAGVTQFTITKFRGSVFICQQPGPFFGRKCICTLDPGTVLTTNYGAFPLFKFDLRKAVAQSTTPHFNAPRYNFDLTLTPNEILERLDNLPQRYALDIEGGVPNPYATTADRRFPNGITCLSIATSTRDAFIIPFQSFSVEDTVKIILKLRKVFADSSTEKVLQNGLYDSFVLAWEFSIYLSNITWDTMLSGFELYPELPKSLETQCSLYTDQPYYKAGRKSTDQMEHWAYCCTDSCVTLEIANKHLEIMQPAQLDHFRFNMAMIPVLLYMELRGMAFDRALANELLLKTQIGMGELQTRINTRAGHPVNINSPKQLCALLYDQIGLPVQHPPKLKGHGVDKTKRTSNIDAILNICQSHDVIILHEILAWRKLEKIRGQLAIKTDRDQRVRCSYNPVGTETNRLSSSKPPTGTGANLQTITKKLRMLYSAGPSISKHTPEPRYFFQVDLAGADGWTVAAHCNALGDPTMLEDYLAGIKPARVIGLMHLRGADVSRMSRAELAIESKIVGVGEHEALYFVCKQVQHGSNYQLGLAKMAKLIVKNSYKDSGKPLRVSTAMCSTIQQLYFARYKGVKNWQKMLEDQIKRTGQITAASGHTRLFLGRRNSSETFREAYAQEPQHNTTYATNRAILNLWNDPENRNPDGSFIIEPHHQVHDALNGSFPASQVEFAVRKIRSYFDFSLRIAGQDITIPFEGEYGDNWGHKVGNI